MGRVDGRPRSDRLSNQVARNYLRVLNYRSGFICKRKLTEGVQLILFIQRTQQPPLVLEKILFYPLPMANFETSITNRYESAGLLTLEEKMSTDTKIQFSVFTKPWKQSLSDLGPLVKGWGFDGIELPVRPGYQVLPENVSRDLPQAAKLLASEGLQIFSVAGPADEATLSACAEAGVPLIRIMASIAENEGYLEAEQRYQREFDALLPLLQKYGVKIGLQNHVDRFVANAMGLRHLIEKYDPALIGAVWDAAHNALSGEEPELGLDIVWSHLSMVNLKNAFWNRINGPEAEQVLWRPWWTSGRQGLANWPRVAAELKRRDYQGIICLTAEYSDETSVERLIAADLLFARSLFA